MLTSNERQLIALLQETGDPKVADRLFVDKALILKRFLLARGASIDEVDDIVQEALLSAFLHINNFRGAANFSTWLCRIAYTKWIDSTRVSSRWIKLLSRIRDSGVTDIPVAHDVDFERFENILGVLSEPQQKVFLHCDWLGHSHGETAKLLRLPLGSVKTYLAQARQLINSKIETSDD